MKTIKKMMKIKKTKMYYHAFPLHNLHSIKKHGLVQNPTDPGVFFTDDAISSLNWVKHREKQWKNKNHKRLGLAIFEVDENDELLVPFKDYKDDGSIELPKELEECFKSQSVVYRNDIPPSKLKFEECVVDGDEYDCYELENNLKYVPPTTSLKIKLMVEGYKNSGMKPFYKILKSNKQTQIEMYKYCISNPITI